MRIVITGANSGIGQGLVDRLQDHSIIELTRNQLDLANIDEVLRYELAPADMLINCAGTGVGGKIDFVNHVDENVVDILNTNLISPMLLTKKVLYSNANCKIVNITSTNNNRYWPNDLAYSLSKSALSSFGEMLRVEYPDIPYLEIRLGLIRTNFNHNRYRDHSHRFSDIYSDRPCLTVDHVVDRITSVLFDATIKFVEISP